MSGGPTDWLRAAIGDDGTGPLWRRLNRDGREMIRLAYVEAREFGHPGIADEHLVLGLLRHGTGPARASFEARDLDPPTVRSELLRLAPNPGTAGRPGGSAAPPLASTPTTYGQRLTTSFGTAALAAAERREPPTPPVAQRIRPAQPAMRVPASRTLVPPCHPARHTPRRPRDRHRAPAVRGAH